MDVSKFALFKRRLLMVIFVTAPESRDVVDDERYLVGIVTNRDLRFVRDMNKHIDEVMTKENIITTNPVSYTHLDHTTC